MSDRPKHWPTDYVPEEGVELGPPQVNVKSTVVLPEALRSTRDRRDQIRDGLKNVVTSRQDYRSSREAIDAVFGGPPPGGGDLQGVADYLVEALWIVGDYMRRNPGNRRIEKKDPEGLARLRKGGVNSSPPAGVKPPPPPRPQRRIELTPMERAREEMPPLEERSEYPRCPRCGGPVVSALMTSGSVEVSWPDEPDREKRLAYFAKALSVYCCSAECNYDKPLAHIPYPPPDSERGRRVAELEAALRLVVEDAQENLKAYGAEADAGDPVAQEAVQSAVDTICCIQRAGLNTETLRRDPRFATPEEGD